MKIVIPLLAVVLFALAPLGQGNVAFAESKACPPGLAKKNPPCVPPGLAKKGVTAHQWQGRHQIGDVVGRDDLIFLDEYALYDLPPLRNGQRYAVVNDQIVVIDAETFAILQLIRVFTALAN